MTTRSGVRCGRPSPAGASPWTNSPCSALATGSSGPRSTQLWTSTVTSKCRASPTWTTRCRLEPRRSRRSGRRRTGVGPGRTSFPRLGGRVIPVRDRRVGASSRNYRFSANVQVIVDADTKLVIATARPVPGTAADARAWRDSGLARPAPPRHPRHRRPGIPRPPQARPKSRGTGPSLYQTLDALQDLLRCWTGTCSTCGRPLARSRTRTYRSTTSVLRHVRQRLPCPLSAPRVDVPRRYVRRSGARPARGQRDFAPAFRRERAANVPGQIRSSCNSRGPVALGYRPRPELMAAHELELDALAQAGEQRRPVSGKDRLNMERVLVDQSQICPRQGERH